MDDIKGDEAPRTEDGSDSSGQALSLEVKEAADCVVFFLILPICIAEHQRIIILFCISLERRHGVCFIVQLAFHQCCQHMTIYDNTVTLVGQLIYFVPSATQGGRFARCVAVPERHYHYKMMQHSVFMPSDTIPH